MQQVFKFKRINKLSTNQLYVNEDICLSRAMEIFEVSSCGELTKMLDEMCPEKRALPWEYRRAYRIRHLSDFEKEQYYDRYSTAILDDGRKQLQLLRKVLARLAYAFYDEPLEVLDVGTGRGGFFASLQKSNFFPNARFEGLDIDMASLLINLKLNEELKNNDFLLTCYNGEELPFNDYSYDLITSFCTLEHAGNFERQVQFLNECYRCLKINGVAILTFPNRFSFIMPEEHVKLWFLGFIPQKFKDNVSYKICGMPSSDIYPLNMLILRKVLNKMYGSNYELFCYTEFHSKKLIRLVARNYIYRMFGPGYVLAIMK